jgi:hypothetical protein
MRFPIQSAGVIDMHSTVHVHGSIGHIVSSQLCTNCGPVPLTECFDTNTNTYSRGTCVRKCTDPATGGERVECCPPRKCGQLPPSNECCKQVCCEARVV